jgi:Integrase core domain/Integrase zinc binding domain
VKERFYWQGIDKDVKLFVKRCRLCQQAKGTDNNKGMYIPLPIPEGPWSDVSMDFVVGFPCTKKGHDSIMVIIDRFSKMAVFITCKTTMDASKVADLYFGNDMRHYGLPASIVSDRDVKFMSHFWKELLKKLGTVLKCCSLYHPQTNGQTEVVNKNLGNMLRA